MENYKIEAQINDNLFALDFDRLSGEVEIKKFKVCEIKITSDGITYTDSEDNEYNQNDCYPIGNIKQMFLDIDDFYNPSKVE